MTLSVISLIKENLKLLKVFAEMLTKSSSSLVAEKIVLKIAGLFRVSKKLSFSLTETSGNKPSRILISRFWHWRL